MLIIKTFAEDVISQFHTIDIDRRRGSKKVKTLFGVKTLDKLKFNLISAPVFHHLNKVLQNEILDLKPYLYSFRINKDKSGNELKLLKNSQINLCTHIEPEYIHDGEEKAYKLKPFEFVHIKKKNEVFLLIEDLESYQSFRDLQNDLRFSDAIAEIFSNIVKVDTHRSNFRELFRESKKNRNYIIETELDDKELKLLKQSRMSLDVVDDPKIQFWFNILITKKINFQYGTYNDNEFLALINDLTKLDINDYPLIYDDLSCTESISIIIVLFKKLSIDIDEFNNNSTITINALPYYYDEIINLKNEYQIPFGKLLFKYLEDRSVVEKESFISLLSQYEKLKDFPIADTVHTNIGKIFRDTIISQFEIDTDITIEDFDLTSIYKDHFQKLTTSNKKFKNALFSEFLSNNDSLRSLVYFKKPRLFWQI